MNNLFGAILDTSLEDLEYTADTEEGEASDAEGCSGPR